MSLLSGWLKKQGNVGKKLRKAFRVPKKHRRRWEEAWTRPSAWRAWKPGRDRGLGLGKAVTGGLQAFLGAMGSTDTATYKKLSYMADEAPSFGKDWFDWFSADQQELYRRYEDKWTAGSDDMATLTDQDIYSIFESGNKDDIKGFLKMYGAEDIQDTYLDWLNKSMFNVKDARARSLNKLLKGRKTTMDEFTKTLMSEKRGGSRYGTGEWDQDSTIDELMLKLHTDYGDATHEATANVVDDILRLVDQ